MSQNFTFGKFLSQY